MDRGSVKGEGAGKRNQIWQFGGTGAGKRLSECVWIEDVVADSKH